MKKGNNKNGMSTGAIVGIGAGVAALAATSYYFFGPEGKKHRKNLKGWMIKMKGEIVDKLEDAKEVTQGVYDQIVDSVAAGYLKGGKATKEEVGAFVDTLKRQWQGIASSTKKSAKSGAKKVKSVAKKAVTPSKKSSKKASKKS